MQDDIKNTRIEFEKVTLMLNAMQFAQLTAFALALPQLYFCREYQHLEDTVIIQHCKQRLLNLIDDQQMTLQQLHHLLTDKDYFDAYEARLRVAPESVE
ncbi:hypothetical protein E2R68_00245 [Psychromonas sp. RZ22]|uniref:hypothetical protein n=1 Tax=Psychromonas algarum TaxID=2555643 RepID=UPI0010676DDA|nr:hypothetical protein [Psychromonas sp. RZ22]TEW56506.1 hypothetical protein E2R68_00245 [Psychromonas sp. RZ22]